MATRSSIAVSHNGVIKAVYCHYDGYLEGVGATLLENYNSAKANYLVALGNVSVLRQNVEIPVDVEHSFEDPNENVTVFYGRDRGETGQDWQVFHSEDSWIDFYGDCEYFYLMDGGVWYVSTGGKFAPLHEALTVEEEYYE
jgi:hypothetical protein